MLGGQRRLDTNGGRALARFRNAPVIVCLSSLSAVYVL